MIDIPNRIMEQWYVRSNRIMEQWYVRYSEQNDGTLICFSTARADTYLKGTIGDDI